MNFQDGCSNPKKLIDELNNAKVRRDVTLRYRGIAILLFINAVVVLMLVLSYYE